MSKMLLAPVDTGTLGWVSYLCFHSSLSLADAGAYTSESTNIDILPPSPYSFPMLAMSPSSLGSRSVPWLGEGFNMPPPSYPILQSSSRSCRSSICQGRLSTTWVVSLVAFYCRMVCTWWPATPRLPARSIGRLWGCWCALLRIISFFFSHCWLYLCLLSSLPDPDVGLSVLVYNVEHTFHVGPCDRRFVQCLFCECPCQSWQHTGVVHMCHRADGNVAFENTYRILVLAYAALPAMIIRCIYLSWLLFVKLYCCLSISKPCLNACGLY